MSKHKNTHHFKHIYPHPDSKTTQIAYQQARIPLTQEQFEKMISKVVHQVVAMEEM